MTVKESRAILMPLHDPKKDTAVVTTKPELIKQWNEWKGHKYRGSYNPTTAAAQTKETTTASTYNSNNNTFNLFPPIETIDGTSKIPSSTKVIEIAESIINLNRICTYSAGQCASIENNNTADVVLIFYNKCKKNQNNNDNGFMKPEFI